MRALLPVALLSLGACASGGGAVPTTGGPTTTTTLVTETTLGSSQNTDLAARRDDSGVTSALPVSAEQAWNSLVATYAALGVPPGTVNVQARLYGNEALEPKDGKIAGLRTTTILNCGTSPTGAPLAMTYRVRLSVLSALAANADGTSRLTTRVMGTAANRAIAGSTPVTCGSTGKLEERIAQLVSEQVRR